MFWGLSGVGKVAKKLQFEDITSCTVNESFMTRLTDIYMEIIKPMYFVNSVGK